MARSRNIKPGFFSSEQLGRCEPCARLLFASLWTLADREGRVENRPMKIRAYAFPYDPFTVAEVESWLGQLEAENLIERYENQGVKVILISAFLKHQNPHLKEVPSKLPDKPGASTAQAPDFSSPEPEKHQINSHSSCEETRLIPDSPIPHPESLIPQSATCVDSPIAMWTEKLCDLHPHPSDPRFPMTFCSDNWHRLGEDPGRYEAFMYEVYRGLLAYCAHWALDGNRFAISLDKWLAGSGWKKSPPKVVEKNGFSKRDEHADIPLFDFKAEAEKRARIAAERLAEGQ